eukprot:11213-Heterococcus_DN1.PRE.4
MAHRYVPALADSARTKLLYSWKKAVSKALNWDDDSVTAQALERQRSRSSMSSSSIIDSSSSSRAQGDTTTAAPAAAAAADSSSAACAVKRKLRGQRSAKGDAPCGDVCVTWREAGVLTAAVAAVFSAGIAVGLLALRLGSNSSSGGSSRLRR